MARISAALVQQMKKYCLEFRDLETGGDLFGKWEGATPVVEYVLGPGPDAVRTSVSFFQDEEFLESKGNALARFGLEHIGEWHSHHHLHLPRPSGGDSSTVTEALDEYNREHFLLCIATFEGAPDGTGVAVRPFIYTRGKRQYSATEWKIVAPAANAADLPPDLQQTSHATEPWYTKDKQMLTRMMEVLTSQYGTPKVRRGVESGTLDMLFTQNGTTFGVVFPKTFPTQAAILVGPGQEEHYWIGKKGKSRQKQFVLKTFLDQLARSVSRLGKQSGALDDQSPVQPEPPSRVAPTAMEVKQSVPQQLHANQSTGNSRQPRRFKPGQAQNAPKLNSKGNKNSAQQEIGDSNDDDNVDENPAADNASTQAMNRPSETGSPSGGSSAPNPKGEAPGPTHLNGVKPSERMPNRQPRSANKANQGPMRQEPMENGQSPLDNEAADLKESDKKLGLRVCTSSSCTLM